MVRHTGGKVGNAAKALSNPRSTKSEKTKAAKVLKKHQDNMH